MATELTPNTEEAAALDRIDAELTGTGRAAFVAADAIDLGDLCKKYQALKGSLEILLKFIKRFQSTAAK